MIRLLNSNLDIPIGQINMKKLNLTILAYMLLSAISINAFADDQQAQTNRESYFNGLIGESIGTSSGATNALSWGARFGTTLLATEQGLLSLGVAVGGASSATSVGSVTVTGNNTMILAEFIARKAFGTGLYFGGRFGPSLLSSTVVAGAGTYSASATSFGVGPAAGYEIPITPNLAINLDASYITVSGTTFTFPTLGATGTTIQTNAASAVILQAGVVYHW